MTILWCGNEDICWKTLTGTIEISTSSSYADINYSRCSLYYNNALDSAKSPEFTPVSDVWLSFRLVPWNFKSSNAGVHLINSSTGGGILFGPGSSANKAAIYTYNGTSYVKLAEESGISVIGGKYDIQVIGYNTLSGTINVYFNGMLIITYTGVLSVLSQTTLNQVYVSSAYSNVEIYLSEFIVADEDTRLMRLKTHYPSASGDTSNWVGTYADIDETALSDLDLIYSGTPNAEFQCNLSNLPSGNYQIKAVKVAARQNNNTGFGTQIGIKTNGTVNLAAAQQSVGTWGTKEVLYQVNPVTNNNFTMAEVDALQFAAKHVVV